MQLYHIYMYNIRDIFFDPYIELLEFKPCGLGFRIQDMEAESYNLSHLLVNI